MLVTARIFIYVFGSDARSISQRLGTVTEHKDTKYFDRTRYHNRGVRWYT